jgi:hypothetical protein
MTLFDLPVFEQRSESNNFSILQPSSRFSLLDSETASSSISLAAVRSNNKGVGKVARSTGLTAGCSNWATGGVPVGPVSAELDHLPGDPHPYQACHHGFDLAGRGGGG